MGIGSINHWSNNYRDRAGMFIYMPMHSFDNMIAGSVNNPNYFENVAIPYAKKHGITLNGEDAENIWSGWSLYEITDFNRTTYVTCLGDIGQMTLINGGYTFSNSSAGVALSGVKILPNEGADVSFFGTSLRFISEVIPYNSYFGGAINTQRSIYNDYKAHGLNSYGGKLLMHEFGHYLQNQYGGLLCYNLGVVPVSIYNINTM